MAINNKANELLERLESKLRDQLLSIRIDRKGLEDFLEYAVPEPEPKNVAVANSSALLEALSNIKEGSNQKETIHQMFKEISQQVRGCGLILLGAGNPYVWPGPKFGLTPGERIGSKRVNVSIDNDSLVNKVATTGEMLLVTDLSDTEKKIYQALDVTYPTTLALIPLTINGRIQAVAMADTDEGEIHDPTSLAIMVGVACSVIEHLPFKERIGFSQFPRFRETSVFETVTEKDQTSDPFPEPQPLRSEAPVAPTPLVQKTKPIPTPTPTPVKPVKKAKPAPAPAPPVVKEPEPPVVEFNEPAPAPVEEAPAEIGMSSVDDIEPETFISQTLDDESEEKPSTIEIEKIEEPATEFTFDSEEKKPEDNLDEYELPEISNEDVAELMPTNLQSVKVKAPVEEKKVEEEIEFLDSNESFVEETPEIEIDISEPAPEPDLDIASPVELEEKKPAKAAPEPVEIEPPAPDAPSFTLEDGQDPDSINTEVVPAEDPGDSVNSDLMKFENFGLAGYNVDHLSDEAKRKHQKAIRFARLLVSEIKLYNEEQVKIGKDKADILKRLKDDIERSEILFKQRISDEVRNDSDYFRAEMIRQLADGDASLLGG